MIRLFLIGSAGFIGTLGRHWLSGLLSRRYGETFPFGTLTVNLLGCFIIGLVFYLMQERYPVSESTRSILLIGLLGGFTTFSALGLQTFTLLRNNEIALAALYIVASNVLGLLLVWAGYSLAKAI